MKKEELIKLIEATRNEICNEFQNENNFAGYCDIVCERLIKKLPKNAKIIVGDCIPNWDENEKLYHYWILLDDLIIEPTSDQMGFDSFLIDPDSSFYKNYLTY